jgi:hypothetical protein
MNYPFSAVEVRNSRTLVPGAAPAPSPATPSAQSPAPSPASALRAQLRERFPHAHAAATQAKEEAPPTSWEIPAGALTELVAPGASAGCGLLIADLMAELEANDAPEPLALIDGADAFDPASHGAARCARVLWVRCREVAKSLKVADLLLRDGNLPWIVLDLAGLPETELRRIPGSSWHRLHGLARKTGARLLVMTRFALVPKPALRVFLEERLSLEDLEKHLGEAAGRGLHALARAKGPASRRAAGQA